jgi:hypothetical protein
MLSRDDRPSPIETSQAGRRMVYAIQLPVRFISPGEAMCCSIRYGIRTSPAIGGMPSITHSHQVVFLKTPFPGTCQISS